MVILVVFISILKPILNISKTTIIDLIRKNKYNKITKRTIKTPKIITKIFKITGDLAYKNVRRSRYKYISIITSLTISIVLFITINGYINNLKSYNQIKQPDFNYNLTIIKNLPTDKDYTEEVLTILNDFGLIDSIYGMEKLNTMFTIIENEDINPSFINAFNNIDRLKNNLDVREDGTIQTLSRIITLDNATYNEYLKQLGDNITLNENECILVNYSDAKTKYYDGIYLTNYQEGDKIILNTMDRREDDLEALNEFSEKFGMAPAKAENKQIELNIKVVSNIIPKGISNNAFGSDLYLIVNIDTFAKLFKETLGVDFNYMFNYSIKSSNTNKVDEIVYNLNEKYNHCIIASNLSVQQQSNENEKNIKEILLYSFFILIFVLTIINVFNIIVSNMILRKNEFAELTAIGMSNKQINKMLMLEGLFYGTTSLIIGLIISIIILYILYKKMIDTTLYAFTIPYISILLVLIIIYAVIFISIIYAKNQINKENISSIIKEK